MVRMPHSASVFSTSRERTFFVYNQFSGFVTHSLSEQIPLEITIHNSAGEVVDLIRDGRVSEGLLNRVEMAFRAYDPCFGCATHFLPGRMPLQITIHDAQGNPVEVLK
jgi:hypothetical protein